MQNIETTKSISKIWNSPVVTERITKATDDAQRDLTELGVNIVNSTSSPKAQQKDMERMKDILEPLSAESRKHRGQAFKLEYSNAKDARIDRATSEVQLPRVGKLEATAGRDGLILQAKVYMLIGQLEVGLYLLDK